MKEIFNVNSSLVLSKEEIDKKKKENIGENIINQEEAKKIIQGKKRIERPDTLPDFCEFNEKSGKIERIVPNLFFNCFEEKYNETYIVVDSFYYFFKERLWIRLDDKEVEGILLSFIYSFEDNLLSEFISSRRISDLCSFVKTSKIAENNVLTKEKIELDNLKEILILKNTVLDLEKISFMEYSKKYYNTYFLEIVYDKNAKCPNIIKFLKEIFPSELYKNQETLILHLQEIIGYCLTSDVSFEKCFLFWGQGANGKSVLLHLIQKLLGNLACSLGLEMLLGNNKFFLAELQGKTANIITEANTKILGNELFKNLISGEKVVADVKFSQPVSFFPFAKFIFSSNFCYISKDTSEGFYRRWDVLEFKRRFLPSEQNRNLKKELEKELQGFFNWALEGLIRLRKQGDFTFSEDFNESFENFRNETDPFKEFLEENFERTEIKEEFISAKEFRTKYCDFCKTNGYLEFSENILGKKLKQLGYEKVRWGGRDKREYFYKNLKKL